jgi:hypothetical protein
MDLKAMWTKLNKPLFVINIFFVVFYLLFITVYPVMWDDESYFSNPAVALAMGQGMGSSISPGFLGFDKITFYHPPMLFFILAFTFKFFGVGLLQGRVTMAIIAIVGVDVFYFTCREFVSKKTALFTTILFGTIPIYFIAAREIRMDILYCVFGLISFYLVIKYYKNEQKKDWLFFVAGIFSAAGFLSHPNGIITIFATVICMAMFGVKLQFKSIFSKDLVMSIKQNFRRILVYLIGVILAILPYYIYAIANWSLYYPQVAQNELFSLNSLFSNVLQGYLQYEGFFTSFSGKSLDIVLRVGLGLVAFGILALGVVSLFLRSYDDEYAKFTFIYTIISAVLLCVLLSQKFQVFLVLFLPQLVIGVGIFVERVPSKLTGLGGWYRELLKFVDSIKSVFQKRLVKKVTIPAVLLVAFLGINIASSEIRVYDNRNVDPSMIQPELQSLGITNTSLVIIGNVSFYLPLYQFHYVDAYTLWTRMYYMGESFTSILYDIRPSIILYDNSWRTADGGLWNSTATDPLFSGVQMTMMKDLNAYIWANCTLLGTITNSQIPDVPIRVYQTNF